MAAITMRVCALMGVLIVMIGQACGLTSPELVCSSFENELPNTDTSGTLIAKVGAANSSACCGLCEEAEGCEGFAFAGYYCYLKKEFLGTFYAEGVISQVKSMQCNNFAALQEGKDLDGRLLEHWEAPSAQVCCQSCGRKDECEGYVFFESMCYLKADVEEVYDAPGRMASLKVGVDPSREDPVVAPTLSACPNYESQLTNTDMSGTLIAKVGAANSSACCGLCEEAEGCEGFSFVGYNCYLKKAFLGTYHQAGVVTQIRRMQCTGFAAPLPGKDLAGRLLDEWDAPSSEVCCEVCGRNEECQGYVFFENRCYLKADVEGEYDAPGRTASLKVGVTPPPDWVTPVVPVRPMCPNFEIALNNTDMSGTLIAQVGAANASACCGLCEEAEGCEGFSFFGYNCYLKKDFLGTYYQEGVVSHLKSMQCNNFSAVLEGKDLVGRLLEHWDAPSPQACCLSCGRKDECQGYAFFENRCYLKADVQAMYDAPGRASSVKMGVDLLEATPGTGGVRRLGDVVLV